MGFMRRKHKAQANQVEPHNTPSSADSLYSISTAASTVHSLSTAPTLYSNDNTTATTLSLSGTTFVDDSNVSIVSSSQDGSQSSFSRKQKARRSLARYQSYADISGVVSQTKAKASATKMKAQSSVLNLEHQMREYVTTTSVDMYGTMLRKLDDAITSMDEGLFRDKGDLVTTYGDEVVYTKTGTEKEVKQTSIGSSFFSKPYLYNNSRLPANLSPLQIPPQTYALIRLAAQYSSSAYRKPAEPTSTSNPYVSANIHQGTKAMVIKPLASDDLQSIVLAIRGTQSFRDWAVNMKALPTSPRGFLDDPYNLCHTGFLAAAQKMIPPVAAYLRDLIAEDPNRAAYSLVLTGHSAGGAVASLLYCHLLATSIHVSSDLRHLASFFGSIHCVTFGAPPVSVRPLFPRKSAAAANSIFFAFVNEGDPVPRAEKPYVTSLLNLYMSPAPFSFGTSRAYPFITRQNKPNIWNMPPATLSPAGNVVLLRKQVHDHLSGIDPNSAEKENEIEARLVPNEILKEVIFGDPIKHMMGLYLDRIDHLARRAQQQPLPAPPPPQLYN